MRSVPKNRKVLCLRQWGGGGISLIRQMKALRWLQWWWGCHPIEKNSKQAQQFILEANYLFAFGAQASYFIQNMLGNAKYSCTLNTKKGTLQISGIQISNHPWLYTIFGQEHHYCGSLFLIWDDHYSIHSTGMTYLNKIAGYITGLPILEYLS